MAGESTVIKFYSLEALQAMTDAQLESLWDGVPTDRQRSYKSMYEDWLIKEGVSGSVGSDQVEKQVVDSLLQQYEVDALVPAAGAWVNVAQYMQERARKGEEAVEASAQKASNGPSPVMLAAGGAALLLAL